MENLFVVTSVAVAFVAAIIATPFVIAQQVAQMFKEQQ